MDVKVEHHLAARGLAELLQRDAIGAECVDADLGDLLRDPHHVGEVVGRDVQDVARRRLRDHQRVTWRPRHDVEEGQRLVVLVNLEARDLAAQDLGENIVRVVGGHRNLSQAASWIAEPVGEGQAGCVESRRSLPGDAAMRPCGRLSDGCISRTNWHLFCVAAWRGRGASCERRSPHVRLQSASRQIAFRDRWR